VDCGRRAGGEQVVWNVSVRGQGFQCSGVARWEENEPLRSEDR
jgi:hypothetical protein